MAWVVNSGSGYSVGMLFKINIIDQPNYAQSTEAHCVLTVLIYALAAARDGIQFLSFQTPEAKLNLSRFPKFVDAKNNAGEELCRPSKTQRKRYDSIPRWTARHVSNGFRSETSRGAAILLWNLGHNMFAPQRRLYVCHWERTPKISLYLRQDAFCLSTHNATLPLKITRETLHEGSRRGAALGMTQKPHVSFPERRSGRLWNMDWSECSGKRGERPGAAADISLWA